MIASLTSLCFEFWMQFVEPPIRCPRNNIFSATATAAVWTVVTWCAKNKLRAAQKKERKIEQVCVCERERKHWQICMYESRLGAVKNPLCLSLLRLTFTPKRTEPVLEPVLAPIQTEGRVLLAVPCDQIGQYFGLLGNLSKPVATISLPQSSPFLGNFCKGVKIYYFSSETIFGKLLQTFGDFYLVTLLEHN